MKFRKVFLTVLAAVSITTPAYANNADTDRLLGLIKESGTRISFNTNHFDKNCLGNKGYYIYKHKVQDLLVICKDQLDANNPDSVWEVVAHESTHIMQACFGSETAFRDEDHPSMFRALATRAPHYAKMIDNGYHSRSARSEAEAFWMELQPADDVIAHFVGSCLEEEGK